MPFVITSEREVPSVRYEKVGRLRPGDNAVIGAIRDRYGEICSIPTGDVILALNGLPVDGISVSESGKMIEITGVSKSSEAYSCKVVYENNEGKAVGTISIKVPTSGAFTTDVSMIIGELLPWND